MCYSDIEAVMFGLIHAVVFAWSKKHPSSQNFGFAT